MGRLANRLAIALAGSILGACGSAELTRSTLPGAVRSSVSAVTSPSPRTSGVPTAAPSKAVAPALTARRAPVHPAATRPAITQDRIRIGPGRMAEMVAYSRRHYGSFLAPTFRLVHPRVIVEHYTETTTFASAFNTFASDVPDVELRELPQTCAHFVIDRGGTIYQLVSTSIMCRHTVGLNWTAIGVEHVGLSDQQVLDDRAQMRSSLALSCWLRSRFGIALANTIGHNESLSSRYHREDVARLRSQTHSDFNRSDMTVYRARMRRACPRVAP